FSGRRGGLVVRSGFGARGFQDRNPIPLKIRRVWGLLHPKSYVVTKCPPFVGAWKLGEGVPAQGVSKAFIELQSTVAPQLLIAVEGRAYQLKEGIVKICFTGFCLYYPNLSIKLTSEAFSSSEKLDKTKVASENFPYSLSRPRWSSGKVSALGPEGSRFETDPAEALSCMGPVSH
ncbi:Transposable element Tc3 transposase, partial [Araneus ventricosus]